MDSKNEREVKRQVHLSLRGDSRAFDWIIRKYQKRIYFTILQIVLNHDDADDVLQETFIKSYTKLNTFDASYPFYPWLYRIAVNTALNYQKKKARYRAMTIDNIDNNGHNGHYIDLAELPRQICEIEGDELAYKLREALKIIPCEQRVVFMLRVKDCLSYKEISETLEISIGTVMSRLSRAREKLRKLLQDHIITIDLEG